MDKLLAFIKTLDKPSREAFFCAIGTTEGYVRKVASTGKLLGPATCVAIEKYPGCPVQRKNLRPDDWPLYWPELIDPEKL
jgi:hypothetical protein